METNNNDIHSSITKGLLEFLINVYQKIYNKSVWNETIKTNSFSDITLRKLNFRRERNLHHDNNVWVILHLNISSVKIHAKLQNILCISITKCQLKGDKFLTEGSL